MLRGLVDDFCVVYLDDILAFSWTKEEHLQHLELVIECLRRTGLFPDQGEHLQHLELVIERLQRAGLYANPKCGFCRPEVEFLDFLVNKQSIRMDPTRVKSITEWPRPRRTEISKSS